MIQRITFLMIFIFCLNLPLIQAQNEQELIVYAAASLTDAFETIGTEFEALNPGGTILYNFAGSSTLSTQLLEGAPADIFASANQQQMMNVIAGGRITQKSRDFAKNRLVLILPADNPADIQSLYDIANADIKLVLAAPEVPVRVYTDTMLEKMAADAIYGEAYRTAVLENIVSEEPNVRQVAAKVALGEADAGIVYLSDVSPDIVQDIIALPIPDEFNTIAIYPIAITNDSEQPELARRFLDFVLSADGQRILEAWNFVPIATSTMPTEKQTLASLWTILQNALANIQ